MSHYVNDTRTRMKVVTLHLIILVTLFTISTSTSSAGWKKPTVLISVLVRNKAHTLPYFLSFLERLNYPKDRIHLWIRSDNNVDNSITILNSWLADAAPNYHGVNVHLDAESNGFDDESGIAAWSVQRFHHIINLREEALNYGRKIWADFIWVLDADAFLTNPDTLVNLIAKNQTVVAPLLKSDGMYSNFWAGITENYYYLRTESYKPILFREETGCFNVPMVHTAVLIDLRTTNSDRLTYKAENLRGYQAPTDDIITFAIGANASDIPLYICNDNIYGFLMVPLENEEGPNEDFQRLTNIKTEILANDNYLPVSENLAKFINYPKEDTLGLDGIFMINLLRRPERRDRMQRLFKELGMAVETINAVDGRTLDETMLKMWGVESMPGYADPYHKRPMTMGEIGCFLSHYVIWKKVIENRYESVMILEDDIRFQPFFRQKINFILAELDELQLEWDLVYLGRKKVADKPEHQVEGSEYLVHAGYSYWTLGYMLSASGARKLVNAMPLNNLVPVDEFLPILSDSHTREDWKSFYPKRDLMVLSSNPLLIYPTHYTGEKGYISDTENSALALNEVTTEHPKREDL